MSCYVYPSKFSRKVEHQERRAHKQNRNRVRHSADMPRQRPEMEKAVVNCKRKGAHAAIRAADDLEEGQV